jgi:hypothetical protein
MNACNAACGLWLVLEEAVEPDADEAGAVLEVPDKLCPNACSMALRKFDFPTLLVPPFLSPSDSLPPTDCVDFVVGCRYDRLLELEILPIELIGCSKSK